MYEKKWISLNKPELGVLNSLSEAVRAEEWRRPDLLDPFRTCAALWLGSDYGGEHKGSKFQTLSFLFSDPAKMGRWAKNCAAVRRRYLRDGRRMSFKSLGDKQRMRALVPFLNSANKIAGLLTTFLIEKEVGSMFQKDLKEQLDALSEVDLSSWKVDSIEKLFRVLHFGSLLLGGLSSPGQDVVWVTDEDDIVANAKRQQQTLELFAHVSSSYLRHGLGHLRMATTKSEAGLRTLEDFVAIPDLVSGSWAEVVTAHEKLPPDNIIGLLKESISLKAKLIFFWLCDDTQPLRRLSFLVRTTEEGKLRSAIIRPHAIPR